MKRVFLIFFVICLAITSLTAQVKFGIITDIHPDIMPDAPARLQTFIDEAESKDLDFIIDLGDFCMVKPQNDPFVAIWNSYKGESYHVIGNHDNDNCTKEQFMEYVGMESRYYSFDKGDFHFIVLDPNNLFDGERYTPYANANFYVDSKKRAWIDPEQVEWLKKDLQLTDKKCIIFSHQSIERSVGNREEIRAILEAENSRVGETKVVAAFSGHDHTNYEKVINGIVYIQINSASDQWLGDKYACDTRFSKEINAKFPSAKYVAPYKDALYAFVTLKKGKLIVDGVQSEYLAPTPADLGVPADLVGTPLTPSINDFKYKF